MGDSIEQCPDCGEPLKPDELGHTKCRACAEMEMARALGPALDLPADWYAAPDKPPEGDES